MQDVPSGRLRFANRPVHHRNVALDAKNTKCDKRVLMARVCFAFQNRRAQPATRTCRQTPGNDGRICHEAGIRRSTEYGVGQGNDARGRCRDAQE